MKNIFKLISVALISSLFSFSAANASSGVFKISHDLGFGKDTNLDAITKGRLFQVVIMTQNRLVRKDLKGVTSAELATDCLLYTSPSPRDLSTSRMPSSA